MKAKVLCMSDASAFPGVLEPLKEVAEVKCLPADREVLRREIRDVDGYLAALAVRADREVLEAAKKLKVIATPSTGLDHLDLDYAAKKGIEILSLKYDRAFLDSITATAEMAWGLLLAVMRKIPSGFEAAKRGEWARDKFRGHQLSGMTFGILGYGRLGTMVGQYARAFRMRVLACEVQPMRAEGIEFVDIETLFRQSDVVSIHVHLTPENTGLVNRRLLSMMKPGAVLINTARGAIVDEGALIEALAAGRLGGAGVDVIHGEWSDLSQHPMVVYARTHDNLVISPHVGGVTYESQTASFRHTATKLRNFLVEKGIAS